MENLRIILMKMRGLSYLEKWIREEIDNPGTQIKEIHDCDLLVYGGIIIGEQIYCISKKKFIPKYCNE